MTPSFFIWGSQIPTRKIPKNLDHPWHVYPNTEYPGMCAHLALGQCVLSNMIILTGQYDLFQGQSQNK